jgi:hypothetical protein
MTEKCEINRNNILRKVSIDSPDFTHRLISRFEALSPGSSLGKIIFGGS